ncbi:MAG: benzoate-CoA ligase family [Gammaproteobacteria bacterium]|nr:benzoate-CoA ligase family [Gammaproteobacteria bacterium]
MNRNAAVELLRANLEGNRGERIAYIDRDGSHSYRSLADRSRQFAHLLTTAGIAPGERVLLALEDTVAFPICFAVAVVASAGLIDRMPAGLAQFGVDSDADGWRDLDAALSGQPATPIQPVSGGDDVAFWLYTSGTTGKPKGVMHTHTNLLATAELYGQGILGLSGEDVVFSAAKLFFAYGLGNSLTFPLSVGATVVLLDTTPRPETVREILHKHRPTVFFSVPTLYARLLNTGNVPREHRIRLCISAGEALPEAILRRWYEATGIEILDGIGSTEMLHMYISNRAGDVRENSG